MSAETKIVRLRKKSAHYSSTPILTTGNGINPALMSPITRNQVLPSSKQDEIARWVEQSTSLPRSSSYTDMSCSSSNSDNTDSSRSTSGYGASEWGWSPPSRDVVLTSEEVRSIQTVYNSYKTVCWVCQTLVNLYTTAARPQINASQEWQLQYTGVPLLLLDAGGSRARGRRRIQLILAERGSGFALWKDTLDNLSGYTAQDSLFHTMFAARDHNTKLGLSFDHEEAATAFLERVTELTSRPENIALSGPKQKMYTKAAGASKSSKHKRYAPPRKTDISMPCGFEHVISVSTEDVSRLFSLQAYVSKRREQEF